MNPDIFNETRLDVIPLQQRQFPSDFANHIINDDCRSVLSVIPDNSIDLCITSPPYFVQKKYEKDWTFAEYCGLMSNVFEHVFRVLKPGGYFVVNFGDYFNSGGRFYDCEVPSVYPAIIGEEWTASASLVNHEAAFPIDLPLWAINVYATEQTELVLDPFLGSGTTMLACVERGLNCIGIEMDPGHCDLAYSRLSSS